MELVIERQDSPDWIEHELLVNTDRTQSLGSEHVVEAELCLVQQLMTNGSDRCVGEGIRISVDDVVNSPVTEAPGVI